MSGLATAVGGVTIRFCSYIGDLVFLACETFGSMLKGRIRWSLLLNQMLEVGYRSQMVVIVTGAFTGSVFAAQAYFQFRDLGLESGVGPVVSVSMCRELGPVLVGLMIAGRVGASMSAEIGTMKVTQQIDALRALAVHPVDYLVVPRMCAMLISMPLLVAESIFFGVLASYVLATQFLGITAAYYMANMVHFTELSDIFMGLLKGFIFGILIVLVSCHEGLVARDGAVGVGRGTTQAVVIGSLMILVVNFFLTMALNIVFPAGQ